MSEERSAKFWAKELRIYHGNGDELYSGYYAEIADAIDAVLSHLSQRDAKLAEMREVLKESQWTKENAFGDKLCVACGWQHRLNFTVEHAPDCKLAALLKEAPSR